MVKEKGVVFEFILTGLNFDSAGEATSKLKRILQHLGISSEVIRRVAISSYEAEINVIIYAHFGIMKAYIFSDRIEIAVEDEGPGIEDINTAIHEGYSTASDDVRKMGLGGGMGLPNMMRCADEFTISSEVGVGTKIYMVIRH